MSEAPKDFLEFSIWRREKRLGRTLSVEERTAHIKTYRKILERDPMMRARATLAFMRKLKVRQGTIPPDFEALYKKKADMDRKLLDPKAP